jgi:hypothetical protein
MFIDRRVTSRPPQCIGLTDEADYAEGPRRGVAAAVEIGRERDRRIRLPPDAGRANTSYGLGDGSHKRSGQRAWRVTNRRKQ